MEEQRHQESMEFARLPCAPELWPVGKFKELFCEKTKKRWVLILWDKVAQGTVEMCRRK